MRGSSRSPFLRLQSVLICMMTIFPLLTRKRARNPACTPRKAKSYEGFLQTMTQTCTLQFYNRSTNAVMHMSPIVESHLQNKAVQLRTERDTQHLLL